MQAMFDGSIGIRSNLSYPSVRTRARAGVMCLRKPPSLRSLVSYTVFHIANNFSEFTISSETLCDHCLRAAESKTVPVDRLIPDSFPHLRRDYARGPYILNFRYHKACVDPVQFPWYAPTGEYCNSKEIIARFCMEKNEWWCDWCSKPLFATSDCVMLASLYAINTVLPHCFILSTPSPGRCT